MTTIELKIRHSYPMGDFLIALTEDGRLWQGRRVCHTAATSDGSLGRVAVTIEWTALNAPPLDVVTIGTAGLKKVCSCGNEHFVIFAGQHRCSACGLVYRIL